MLNFDMKKNFKNEYPDIIEKDMKKLIEWWDKWKHLSTTTSNMPPPPFKKYDNKFYNIANQ